MNRYNVATTLGFMLVSGTVISANAATVEEIKYQSEVRSCVDEIQGQLDINEATRVRHEIEIVREKLVGYAMKIDTSVYTEIADEPTHEYATHCVVNGDHRPLKFTMDELDHDKH